MVGTKIYNRIFCFCLLSWSIVFLNCSMDEEYVHIAYSPVNYDLQAMPYENLSAYNFFQGEIKNLSPVYGVLPYDLINPLFSDYSDKKRFIWMPQDQTAYYIDDSEVFNFPVGAILIKNFSYNGVAPSNETKNIETRLMIKKNEGWIFANYVWNDEQTEAVFNLDGSTVQIEWTENNGYALFIGTENKPKSYVRWELASIDQCTEIKISVAPYFMMNIPKIISFLPFKIYIEPMLKKYLRVVLNGLNDYADPKQSYKKNRFKYHPWFC